MDQMETRVITVYVTSSGNFSGLRNGNCKISSFHFPFRKQEIFTLILTQKAILKC